MERSIRPMEVDDLAYRVGYFHAASDDELESMGVARARLPAPDEWLRALADDRARPLAERDSYGVVWLLDGVRVGFSTLDQIEPGVDARMHLHVVDPGLRGRGHGVEFVELSVRHYLEVFDLERLFCEPKATNVAPNRTVLKAGFRYLCSREWTPGPINVEQVSTRWVFDRAP